MLRLAAHHLLLALCLVVFGLGQIAPTGVRCTDASGRSRIEFACVKSSRGGCTSAPADLALPADHADDDHDRDSAPCEDEPLGLQAAAKSAPASPTYKPLPPPTVAAELSDLLVLQCTPPTRTFLKDPGPQRPPDDLARLRSVILTV